MAEPLLSICIPPYNRPKELGRLLASIDTKDVAAIEVVMCEDKSPKREEIRAVAEEFKRRAPYTVHYYENPENLGYDRNLKELLRRARGTFVVYMSDDDEFVSGALDKLLAFLRAHSSVRYVLRSYYFIRPGGQRELFRYFDGDKIFPPGFETYLALFRKSVFISGFTIHRESVLPHLVDDFDGTLLFQLYLAAEVALKHECAYFDEPLTQGYEGGIPLFGNSETEKKLYTPGTVTVQNSVNFMSGFFKITGYIDRKYGFKSTDLIKTDISKYSYPVLSIQRPKGVRVFLRYVRQLNALGLNRTIYYYLYVIALLVLGKRAGDNAIRLIKKALGRTPRL